MDVLLMCVDTHLDQGIRRLCFTLVFQPPRMYSNRTAQKWASLSEHHIPWNMTVWLFKFVCIF